MGCKLRLLLESEACLRPMPLRFALRLSKMMQMVY